MTDRIGHGVALMRRPNRRVWLAKRRHVLGATDAVAVLGYSKWATPLDVWLAKTGQCDDDRDSYAMKRGRLLESLLITEWATRNPTARLLAHPPLLAHPQHRMIAASLDAAAVLDDEQVAVEAKTAGYRAAPDWWGDAMIPDAYAVQVLLQLAVCGLDTAHVVADIAGDFTTLTIQRDPGFEAWALPALADWWQRHVVGGEIPDIDPVRDYPSLNRVWVPDPGVVIEADPLLLSDIRAHQAAARAAKEKKAVADELRGRIRVAMRDATQVLDPVTGDRLVSVDKGGRLTVKQPAAGSLPGTPAAGSSLPA